MEAIFLFFFFLFRCRLSKTNQRPQSSGSASPWRELCARFETCTLSRLEGGCSSQKRLLAECDSHVDCRAWLVSSGHTRASEGRPQMDGQGRGFVLLANRSWEKGVPSDSVDGLMIWWMDGWMIYWIYKWCDGWMIPLSLPCDVLSSLVWFIVRLKEKQHVASCCRLDTFAALHDSLSYFCSDFDESCSAASGKQPNALQSEGGDAAAAAESWNQSSTRQSTNTFICLRILMNK